MDKVRLGRALGYGTRHAAKTLAAVADAATTPDPRRGQGPERAAEAKAAGFTRPPARMPSVQAARSAGRSFWGPLATFSSALWLRVTGMFFALIALAMANGAWRLRGSVHGPAADATARGHLVVFALFAGLFGYFAVSSFVRANLRERRAAGRRL